MVSPFNDYDANGFRINNHGNRSHKTEDEAIISNLRFRWPEQLKEVSDVMLVNLYDDFYWSEYFGYNDERFLEFIKEQDV